MKIKRSELIKTKGTGIKTSAIDLETLTTKNEAEKFITERITDKLINIKGDEK